jgi:hypothetical protein
MPCAVVSGSGNMWRRCVRAFTRYHGVAPSPIPRLLREQTPPLHPSPHHRSSPPPASAAISASIGIIRAVLPTRHDGASCKACLPGGRGNALSCEYLEQCMVSQLLQVRWHQLRRIPGRSGGTGRSMPLPILSHDPSILYAQARR